MLVLDEKKTSVADLNKQDSFDGIASTSLLLGHDAIVST
jgi:hypothetical protein